MAALTPITAALLTRVSLNKKSDKMILQITADICIHFFTAKAILHSLSHRPVTHTCGTGVSLPHRDSRGPAPSRPASGWKAEARASGSDTQEALGLLPPHEDKLVLLLLEGTGCPVRGSPGLPPRARVCGRRAPESKGGERPWLGSGRPLLRPLALAPPHPHEDPKPVYGFVIAPHCARLSPCYLNTNKRGNKKS